MRYESDWRSLLSYRVPDWFREAKLGIFIHWGVYSVPAFGNEWYPRHMYVRDRPEYEHHRKTWGDQRDFGYKDFIPLFKGERWEPEAWVDLFKRAGARYVVPVAEHHDGFPMYDSSYTPWNAARMGPCRDTIAELATAVRREGLKFGVSTHRAFNWFYYTFSEAFDTGNADHCKLYGVPHPPEAPVSYEFVLDWFARVRELVTRFSPEVFYFDFGWHRDEFRPWRRRVTAYYYNHALENGYEPVLQYKDKLPRGAALLDVERAKLDDIDPEYWQTDTSVSFKSWGYIEEDQFRTPASLVHDLVDIVSKNGNLLLNVGPRADGTIPNEAASLLLALGAWLETNGEAIYGTRPWLSFGEGDTGVPERFREQEQKPYTPEDVRFTTSDHALYAICLGWPGEAAIIKSLGSRSPVDATAIRAIRMLGSEEKLEWSQDDSGLKISTPSSPPCEHAFAFKIEGTFSRS